MRSSLALALTLAAAQLGAADRFDVVIRGGRVMDPETGRDGEFDVGLVGDRIARISAEPLEGARVIDARGRVVAPGFIDLHQHSFSPENDRRKALDGVTAALEMEIGRADVAGFLAERRGHALVHLGTTASHPAARHAAWGGSLAFGGQGSPERALHERAGLTRTDGADGGAARARDRRGWEAYPYEAGMTLVNSALFNPGWREKLGIDYGDLQVPQTGERLTKERFDALHADPTPRWITVFANPVDVMDVVIRHPLVMIASDGITEHPRNAGTFSRILRRYVREQGALTLMDALRKMSLMPARRLETSTPAARSKGRLQEGADADVVVFDPGTIADRATYANPTDPSVGVQYLLVAGTLVVDGGRIVPGAAPGRALVGGR